MLAVPPTPHNSRSDLADDEATEPGVRYTREAAAAPRRMTWSPRRSQRP